MRFVPLERAENSAYFGYIDRFAPLGCTLEKRRRKRRIFSRYDRDVSASNTTLRTYATFFGIHKISDCFHDVFSPLVVTFRRFFIETTLANF